MAKNPPEGNQHIIPYLYYDDGLADVDAHYARAQAAGAEIVSELEDEPYGDRMYTAKDPEGQEWFFGTHVRDVAP